MDLPKIDKDQNITIDLETCDPELKYTAPGYISKVGFVAGIAIAAEEGAWYLPIHHTEGENFPEDEVRDWMTEICSSNSFKIFHNAQYDLGWLKNIGVQLHGQLFDTMLAAPLLDENLMRYSLDNLGKLYLNSGKEEVALQAAVSAKFGKRQTHKSIIRLNEGVTPELKEYMKFKPFFNAKVRTEPLYDLYPKEVKEKYIFLGEQKDKDNNTLFKVPVKTAYKSLLWAVDAEEMGSYPVQDVILTRGLAELFMPKLEQENLTNLCTLENELLPCLLEMREQGTKVDIKGAIAMDTVVSDYRKKLQEELDTEAGFTVNVDAAADLVKVCDKFEIEYNKTDKGNPCFSKEAVPDHEFFKKVLKCRKIDKTLTTYIRGYIFEKTLYGRLHGQYNQLKSDEGGTVTGRLSSSNPNMQNIPSHGLIGSMIRSWFIPDNDEEQWLCMDYSGQEPKMLVNLVLMLNKALGKQVIKNITTGEEEIKYVEGFPGGELAKQELFSGRKANFHLAVAKECMRETNKEHNIQVTEEELMAQAKGFRGKAKTVGLGVMYGLGDQGIADQMKAKGIDMTLDGAKELRMAIYKGVPFLNAINNYVMNIARTRGYVLTLLKRRGRFNLWEIPIFGLSKSEKSKYKPLLFKSMQEANAWLRSDEGKEFTAKCKGKLGRAQRAFVYKALNKIIQGSSADQTKTGMVHLYKRGQMNIPSLDIYYRRSEIVPPKMRTQVHDEINVSLPKEEEAEWYQDVMENCIDLEVESVAEPGLGGNWTEAKADEEEKEAYNGWQEAGRPVEKLFA